MEAGRDAIMHAGRMSLNVARNYRNTLAWSKSILGVALVIAAWAFGSYQGSLLLVLVLLLTAAWATVCHFVEGFIFGRIINPDLFGLFFVLLVIPSPAAAPILVGVTAGIMSYSALIAFIVLKPAVRLIRGNRLYAMRHPLDRIIPVIYLAPEPLAPIFQPTAAFHWSVAAFNIPVLKLSLFDPPSIHNYIKSRTSRLPNMHDNWTDALTCFRRAVGIINLLDSIRKIEQAGLDGVALAASARLALSAIPSQGRSILVEVVGTLKPDRRKLILSAFDLNPSRSY